MTNTCSILLAIIFVPVNFCTPAISKYDLNVDFVEAGLSKLEPERELRSSHVEFIRSRPPIQQSREIETRSGESAVSPKSLFEDESDKDNEIDDWGEDTRLFENTDPHHDDSVPQDTPQLREVIRSFLQVVPNNTLISQLFRKVADTIVLSDSSQNANHNKIKNRS